MVCMNNHFESTIFSSRFVPRVRDPRVNSFLKRDKETRQISSAERLFLNIQFKEFAVTSYIRARWGRTCVFL